jgi:hypothetical protein
VMFMPFSAGVMIAIREPPKNKERQCDWIGWPLWFWSSRFTNAFCLDHYNAAASRIAEYTVTSRQIAERLAIIENQTPDPDIERVTWQEMIIADPTGTMRPAGEIVEEGRAYMQDRMKEMLHAGRRKVAVWSTVDG